MLAFGTFAIGTCEFVLAGLLPQLAESLDVTIPTAGQVVTVFALTCAVLAPVLATSTAGRPRRQVLLIAAAVYFAGNVGTALSPSFPVLLVTQMVAAAGAGLFVPIASVTASALVQPERRGRAIAIVTTGLTAATALGAPIGTVLGGLLGWRAAMFFVAALALIAMLGIVSVVPKKVDAPAPERLRERIAPLADRRVVTVLATTLVAFTAVYIPYTYISVVFAPATGGSSVRLAVLMSIVGVVGTLANYVAGSLADRIGSRPVVAGALVWLAASLFIIPLATSLYPAALVMVFLYGFAAFAITTPQQHRLITLKPESASVLISLNAAILYLGITMSGVLGAAGISLVGAGMLTLLAGGLALLALLLSELAHRLSARGSTTAEPEKGESGKESAAGLST
ncbi:DHA1 family inner membrane transport protein [Spinactinospora alkalitolerans]|uniref:DHA1 family inner membrane transport protein n=1 Tax=Spinactinospora alkalitolerans TaxID=687207 RepID=A0A852U4Q0_9ACTN|nr:MFS transporter [Spinactinospora alkalitolerans]NYE50587.1 DHA1 family inner membrane transport protein [Spinactinospora alkalitolerans]